MVLTLLLIIPLLTMESDDPASSDPPGEVFELRDDINDRFAPRIHGAGYIVEPRSGDDVLTQAVLWELYRNEQRLRQADKEGHLAPEGLPAQPYLYQAFHIEANRPFSGVYSLTDAVADIMIENPQFGVTLETATDEQVKIALHYLFANPETSGLREALSVKASSRKYTIAGYEVDRWVSPALWLVVVADNEKLGGGTMEIGVAGDERVLDKEEFNRNVQRVLRGDEQNFTLMGIAIDVNLEAADEGQTAGYFIMATVIVVVLIAGLSLRSYWAVALSSAGVGGLMIWLKGISNLVGIKGGLVVDMIVPIAMISLGIDFALHSMRRYQEEKKRGYSPGMALRAGFAGVLGALTLAMVTDGIAFLANVSSGIEAVIHFGIAAGIAVFASFIVLGIVLPLALMRIEQLQPVPAITSRRARFMAILNSISVATLAGTGVIFLVAVSKPLGVALLLAMTVIHIGIPLLLMRRRSRRAVATVSVPPKMVAVTDAEPGGWLVALVTGLARYRLVVLPVTIGLTAVATVMATRLEATFDVKDFFDSNSDFVVSLDKVDEHFGKTGGEPGIIYIRGDLTDQRLLSSIDEFIAVLGDNPSIARRFDGEVGIWHRTVVGLLRRITGNDYARGRVAAVTGVSISDADGDGLPDSPSQIGAVYRYILTEGVPLDENNLVYTADQIGEVLYHDANDPRNDVTILTVDIPGTREQQNVVAARDSLSEDIKVLRESPAAIRVGLTGSAFTRLAQLDATTKTLQSSLPIAAVATLLLLLMVMRSWRYAVVTIIPIGLVVAWLYGLMYLTGFALNYVTATIGAVSLGVGIDYAIHLTERFREEVRRATNKMQALRQAANGTGVALLASAVSSIAGFAIMGFAPMPMFSSYGILTALMIFLTLSASLVVLPALLLLVIPEKKSE